MQLSNDQNVLSSFLDGSLFQQVNKDSAQPCKLILPVLLYLDDFETANPLGSRKGIHKLTAVYLSFLSMPQKYRANLQNILLVALALASHVRKYGIDSILSVVTNELKELQRNGIQINCPDEYEGLIIRKLCQVIGDNLAINLMLGCVTSFSANYFCRICKVHRNCAQSSCVLIPNMLRTRDNFATDLQLENYSETGIKRFSVLNTQPYYHVTLSVALDIMHDFQEGILPLELKLVLQALIVEGSIELDELNSRIKCFNLGFSDKRNRPSSILTTHLFNPNGPSGQKAAQMDCLALFFPLLVGDKVDEDSEVWELYLLILHVFKLIKAPMIIHSGTYLLKSYIQEHHELFSSYSLIES